MQGARIPHLRRQACAEQIARYDALLFGACPDPHLQALQTLAKVYDVEVDGLSAAALWMRLRPSITATISPER